MAPKLKPAASSDAQLKKQPWIPSVGEMSCFEQIVKMSAGTQCSLFCHRDGVCFSPSAPKLSQHRGSPLWRWSDYSRTRSVRPSAALSGAGRTQGSRPSAAFWKGFSRCPPIVEQSPAQIACATALRSSLCALAYLFS